MNIQSLAMIATIIASLAVIPFITPQFKQDYIPTGALLLGINESDVDEIPGSISSFYGPEKFEKEIQTPYGKFNFSMSYDKITQTLYRTDRRVVVTQTYNLTEWILQTQELILSVNKNPTKITEICETPNGMLERIRENGSVSEMYYGINFELINNTCTEAEKVLQGEVERMEGMKKQMLDLPPEIVINEFAINSTINNITQWIELYNKEIFDVNLTGWTIETRKTETGPIYTCNLNDIIIRAGNYSLINCSDKFGMTKGMIMLKKEGKIVDQVTYGTFDDGAKTDNAPKPNEGQSTGRCPDGVDTNIDNIDFRIIPSPTPGMKNECP